MIGSIRLIQRFDLLDQHAGIAVGLFRLVQVAEVFQLAGDVAKGADPLT